MLKTTNYLIKKTDDLMPIAYACITKIKTNGLNGRATLSIQSSREKCELVRQGKLEAKHEVEINFVVDYSQHISTIIYETAKGTINHLEWNEETNKYETKEIPNYFNGWDNDII